MKLEALRDGCTAAVVRTVAAVGRWNSSFVVVVVVVVVDFDGERTKRLVRGKRSPGLIGYCITAK